jgi:hypothetical protein
MEKISEKILWRIKNALITIPYFVTLFVICIVAVAIIFGLFNVRIGTPGFMILAMAISALIIYVDLALLFRAKKDELFINPTMVVLFATVFIVISLSAFVYFSIIDIKEWVFALDYMKNEYPNHVETLIYKMNPQAVGS